MCDCVPETWSVRLRTRPRPVEWRGSGGARDKVTNMPEQHYIRAWWRLRNAAYQLESWQACLHVCLRGRNADRYRWRYNVVPQPAVSWLCSTAAPPHPGRVFLHYLNATSHWTLISSTAGKMLLIDFKDLILHTFNNYFFSSQDLMETLSSELHS